jgi:hypothetical protein
MAAVAGCVFWQWLRLLACMFSPDITNVIDMNPQQQARILVAINPRSFSNAELREQYPALLKAPSYLLLEYLQQNPLALLLYGMPSVNEPYGILRLKMMGKALLRSYKTSQLSTMSIICCLSLISPISRISVEFFIQQSPQEPLFQVFTIYFEVIMY